MLVGHSKNDMTCALWFNHIDVCRLLTDAPGYLTRTMAGLQTAKTYEEHELSDEDEYLCEYILC